MLDFNRPQKPSLLSFQALSLTFVLLSGAALAGAPVKGADGGHGGGNGGGGEPIFHSEAAGISDWLSARLADGTLTAKLHLGEAGFDAGTIVSKYEAAKGAAHVKFIPAAKLRAECLAKDSLACALETRSRTCMNDSWNENGKVVSAIECNEDLFNARPGDEQFVLVFHEYLGIAKVETNDSEDFSTYPISKYLLSFAKPKKVVRFELVADAEPETRVAAQECNLYVSLGGDAPASPREGVFNGYRLTQRKKKADFVMTGVVSVYMPHVISEEGASYMSGDDAGNDGVSLIHKSGFQKRINVGIPYESTQSHFKENPWNTKIKAEMADAQTAEEYARLKAKLDPTLDVTEPGRTFFEQVIAQFPPCEAMLGASVKQTP